MAGKENVEVDGDDACMAANSLKTTELHTSNGHIVGYASYSAGKLPRMKGRRRFVKGLSRRPTPCVQIHASRPHSQVPGPAPCTVQRSNVGLFPRARALGLSSHASHLPRARYWAEDRQPRSSRVTACGSPSVLTRDPSAEGTQPGADCVVMKRRERPSTWPRRFSSSQYTAA